MASIPWGDATLPRPWRMQDCRVTDRLASLRTLPLTASTRTNLLDPFTARFSQCTSSLRCPISMSAGLAFRLKTRRLQGRKKFSGERRNITTREVADVDNIGPWLFFASLQETRAQSAEADQNLVEGSIQNQAASNAWSTQFLSPVNAFSVSPSAVVKVTGPNSRLISASILINASLSSVWATLTDYEHLHEFIPSLVINRLLERRSRGARLLQVGEQDVALGFKFRARAVVDVEEGELLQLSQQKQREIKFTMVEGDFRIFRGSWCISEGGAVQLKYSVEVMPQLWLPVAVVEGRIMNEICGNLSSVRREAEFRFGQQLSP
eukprot:TRINITY_DN2371_c0_g1_i1.p1 TRINITY_DN2371_c0_g1~~TRINITY_DN2371_c0_g1_i1.p1  ORF type:complete len:322 (+),score=37.77 TRINITY_DN2371_c0_g1_i1:57-1022(+)